MKRELDYSEILEVSKANKVSSLSYIIKLKKGHPYSTAHLRSFLLLTIKEFIWINITCMEQTVFSFISKTDFQT